MESYDAKAKLYRVVYEDGDAEEADPTHIQQLVQRATAPNPSTRRVEKVRTRFPTAVFLIIHQCLLLRINHANESTHTCIFLPSISHHSSYQQFFVGYGTFQGAVTKYDFDKDVYQVNYDDGDSEELREADLVPLLLPTGDPQQQQQQQQQQPQQPQSTPTRDAFTTPSPNNGTSPSEDPFIELLSEPSTSRISIMKRPTATNEGTLLASSFPATPKTPILQQDDPDGIVLNAPVRKVRTKLHIYPILTCCFSHTCIFHSSSLVDTAGLKGRLWKWTMPRIDMGSYTRTEMMRS